MVRIGQRHGNRRNTLAIAGATTRLVTDATIAALALENGAEVHTNNIRDFQRFPGLLCRNPLQQR